MRSVRPTVQGAPGLRPRADTDADPVSCGLGLAFLSGFNYFFSEVDVWYYFILVSGCSTVVRCPYAFGGDPCYARPPNTARLQQHH